MEILIKAWKKKKQKNFFKISVDSNGLPNQVSLIEIQHQEKFLEHQKNLFKIINSKLIKLKT